VTAEQKSFWDEQGYVVVPGLFGREECEQIRDHFMEIRKSPTPMDDVGIEIGGEDPLKAFPRIIHPHRWDELSMRWMLDPRLREVMTGLLGEEPIAAQTMFYFKPPGARGQALHQDQKYLRARPGTCVAAWLAIDRCDEENGCLQVVPGTQDWPMVCPEGSDINESFTHDQVPLPPGYTPVPVIMEPGDVLFFNGSIVHGSFANRSSDRFRRSLIGHYLTADVTEVSQFYVPSYRFDGTPLYLDASPHGGACGTWVERDGGLELEFNDDHQPDPAVGPH